MVVNHCALTGIAQVPIHSSRKHDDYNLLTPPRSGTPAISTLGSRLQYMSLQPWCVRSKQITSDYTRTRSESI